MKKTLFFMMLLTLTVALCACKGDTKKDGQAADNQSQGQTANSDSVSYGGEIVVGISQDLDSLDPHKAVAAGTKEVLYNIFEG
ncbi:MAG: ABC transporter substrate-binding protein, partial [Lachnospiraceae bacterium]|nr:ABC transporter substrate-binding protein [Lachnospiraceae bacterium]